MRTTTTSGTIEVPAAAKIDPIGSVAASVVAGDEGLRRRVHRLVDALLKDAEHTIKYGSAADRARLMRMVVPALLKSLQSADVGASEEAKGAAYQRMLEAMGGGLSASS